MIRFLLVLFISVFCNAQDSYSFINKFSKGETITDIEENIMLFELPQGVTQSGFTNTTKQKCLGYKDGYLLLEETISNKQIRWEKKNLFWIDPSDHYVWKSIQHISPKLPPFILQVTKRPKSRK